jgi:hypothetical protein
VKEKGGALVLGNTALLMQMVVLRAASHGVSSIDEAGLLANERFEYFSADRQLLPCTSRVYV